MRNLTVSFDFSILNKGKVKIKKGLIDMSSSESEKEIKKNKTLVEDIKEHMKSKVVGDIILLKITGVEDVK